MSQTPIRAPEADFASSYDNSRAVLHTAAGKSLVVVNFSASEHRYSIVDFVALQRKDFRVCLERSLQHRTLVGNGCANPCRRVRNINLVLAISVWVCRPLQRHDGQHHQPPCEAQNFCILYIYTLSQILWKCYSSIGHDNTKRALTLLEVSRGMCAVFSNEKMWSCALWWRQLTFRSFFRGSGLHKFWSCLWRLFSRCRI